MKFLTICAALAVFPVAASAMTCNLQTQAEAVLTEKYNEVVIEEKTVDDGEWKYVWQLWLNEETGSWTVTFALQGIMCATVAGASGYAGQSLQGYIDAHLGTAL